MALTPYQNMYPRYSLRVYHSSIVNGNKNDPRWSGLRRGWVGFVIAKSQCDCENMRKYAIVIQKFQRLLNLEISKFPDLGLYTMDAFENKEEDDDSKLAIIDTLTNEKIKEAEEDEDNYVKG
jgi:hypothetical protein